MLFTARLRVTRFCTVTTPATRPAIACACAIAFSSATCPLSVTTPAATRTSMPLSPPISAKMPRMRAAIWASASAETVEAIAPPDAEDDVLAEGDALCAQAGPAGAIHAASSDRIRTGRR